MTLTKQDFDTQSSISSTIGSPKSTISPTISSPLELYMSASIAVSRHNSTYRWIHPPQMRRRNRSPDPRRRLAWLRYSQVRRHMTSWQALSYWAPVQRERIGVWGDDITIRLAVLTSVMLLWAPGSTVLASMTRHPLGKLFQLFQLTVDEMTVLERVG